MEKKKKRIQIRSFLLGVCVTVLLSSLAMTAFAAGQSKTINVATGVNLYMDDRQVIPTDANGNPVEVFIYNGTTYVPVRAVSNLFDTPIQWDGQTYGVYIGKHSSTKPAAYLEELEAFTGEELTTTSSEEFLTDNMGTRKSHVLREGDFDNIYYLNGNYTSMTGTLFQPKEYNNSKYDGPYAFDYLYTATFRVYGDGRLLYEGTMTGGVFPLDFNIDLTGVLELRVTMNTGDYAHGKLCEVALWT